MNMDNNVIFDTDNYKTSNLSIEKTSKFVIFITDFLIKTHIVKDRQKAIKILVIFFLVILVLSIILFYKNITHKALFQPEESVINAPQPMGPIKNYR